MEYTKNNDVIYYKEQCEIINIISLIEFWTKCPRYLEKKGSDRRHGNKQFFFFVKGTEIFSGILSNTSKVIPLVYKDKASYFKIIDMIIHGKIYN